MTMFNLPCKFQKGTKVKIISGFMKGKKGKIKEIHVNFKPRGLLAKEFEPLLSEPSYEINTGFFSEDICAYESQIEVDDV